MEQVMGMPRRWWAPGLGWLLVLALLLAGCGAAHTAPPPLPGGGQPGGQAPAPPAPADVEAGAQVAAAVNAMGFDVLGGLAARADGGNVITSPVSVAVLLAMLQEGAGGETAAAIGRVLHMAADAGTGTGFAALLRAVAHAGKGVELAVANSLWSREGTPLEQAFLQTARQSFGATAKSLDLGDPQAAAAIDRWVSEQTGGRIEEMAEALGLPNASAVLVLLNAVYFQGRWTVPFDPARTREGAFTRPDGSQVQVPLMTQRGQFPFARGEGFAVARLPYGDDGRFGMEVFLPDPGLDLTDLRATLNSGTWAAAVAALSETDIQLTLPRFELAYETGDRLNEVLHDLGMGIAYRPGEADFRPMSPINPWLDTVVHKTYIRVDEQGTEAAAVTGGVMVESMPPELRLDRPFLFSISDRETGAIVFLGQVADPSAG